ncbi:MAG TPA: pitrilysin family protein [Steroidobacteraceae bacterium]|nr:pitrilysin family protein [Steroidobacteraceae bacterium]
MSRAALWLRVVLLVAVICGAGRAQADSATGVRMPAFARVRLANGADLLLVERHETPLIAMAVTVRGGALGDPAGKDGTAALFAELAQKGAGDRSAEQFAEAVETAGGELGASAGTESIGISARFMARDAALMIGLVADALERPHLEAKEFAKIRTLAVESLAAAKDSDPRGLIGTYGEAWLFHGHPYGRPVEGSERTLAAVTLDDVKRYYAEQVGGDRLIIAVVGDFRTPEMRSKLEHAFGGWRRAAAARPVAPAPVRVQGRHVLLVDKPGATQTYFWLGNVGASRADPARTAQSVVNTLFGGRFSSLLNTELRVKSGLTYGADSGFERHTQPGAFRISSYTRTETTMQAIELALASLDRARKDGFDAAAIASAQSYLLGQFPTSLETNGQLAARLIDMAFYGLGAEDVDQFATRVRAVDEAAARKVLDTSFPDSRDLAVVLIGDAAKIRGLLGKLGPVTEMKITDPQFAPEAVK